ncbi:MAG: hypothetical protein A2W00_08235 [Candidatus Eisenbacteria bacterium RBG_16_71_46]|nr:MAG: hypothetical protein A2W00_08235 [Candidatus Eisenbacteria bacterium RBG_16_71_46]
MAGTLIDIFLETVSALRKPAQFMRRAEGRWEQIPAERALADVESFGLGLTALGVRPGDRVAVLSENRYEWPVADLGILGIGAVTVPIYPTLTAEQVGFILRDCEAKVVLVSSALQLEKIRAVAGRLAGLSAVLCMDPVPADGATEREFASVIAQGTVARRADADAYRMRAKAVRPHDLATIIYTSGTTGEPKGAMLSHHNIVSNVDAALQVIGLRADDTCLSFLPLCHIFERMAGLYAMLRAGATIAYAEGIDQVAANALEVRPTVLIGVPRFYEKVYARVMENGLAQPPLRRNLFFWGLHRLQKRASARLEGREADSLAARLADRLVGAKVRERVGGRLRFCVSGGAPLAPKVMEFFAAIGIPIYEGYGLTETSPVITLNPPGREKPGSVGPPIPGVEVRIGEEGEILTRGPHVMQGYYHNDEATRRALRDGWFHTGDVGHLDADGFLVITDRLKDLLVTAGGKKVAPQPLEARLKTSKWISEAVMLGDRRPYVVCLLVPNFSVLEKEARARGWGGAGLAERLEHPEVLALYQREIERLNRDLAPFEQIKRFALLDRELTQEAGELTPTLKVKRRVIEQRFAHLIEALYEGTATPEGT